MFIQTERTPNPATMKFLPDQEVLNDGCVTFDSVEDATQSPLAQKLFEISGVSSVHLSVGFLSVTTKDPALWDELKSEVMAALMEHYTAGNAVVTGERYGDVKPIADETDDVVRQIRTLLDEKVRPVLEQDGGNIEYRGFEDGVVYLKLLGACSGCPSSTQTLKNGIENLLKHYVPEVREVVEA